jgi:hypothetical protein
VLQLRWDAVRLAPNASAAPGAAVDVEVNVTVARPGQLQFSASVDRSAPGTCLQALALPNLAQMLEMKLHETSLFLPQGFGVVGDAWGNALGENCGGGNCHLDDAAGAFYTNGEGTFMPNGARRNMQWTGLFSNASGQSLGLYLGSQDPLSRTQDMGADGRCVA